MRGMLGMASVCLALAAAPHAAAQVGEDVIAGLTGTWMVLPVDGSPGCTIQLALEQTIGGRLAVPSDECVQHVPDIAEASAWYPTSGIAFSDAIRRPVMAFEEDETTLLSSPSVADPAFYLVPAHPGLTRVPQPADMPGTWRFTSGSIACTLQFEAGIGDGGTVHLAPECPKSELPVAMRRWQLQALGLLLEGDGDGGMAFRAVADGQFDGEGGKQLTRVPD